MPRTQWPHDKKIVIAAIAILVLGYALVALMPKRGGNTQLSNPQPQPYQPAVTPKPVYAPAGELTPGFPKDLILDDAAKVSNSYTIGYNAALNQYTAIFNSEKSAADLSDSYKSYFSKNGWTIVNQTTGASSRGIYAKKSNLIVSVSILTKDKSRQVAVSYLTK